MSDEVAKPAVISASAYKTIILYCGRYANQSMSKNEWKESYGLLSGYSDADFVYIKEAYPITRGHGSETRLQVTYGIALRKIRGEIARQEDGMHLIGWFHSHPGYGLSFSETDILNQIDFQQQDKDFVGVIYDFTLIGKSYMKKINDSTKVPSHHTGLQAYKAVDTTLDVHHPQFMQNYQKVEMITDGITKTFFSRVLQEISERNTKQQPLQMSYEETDPTEERFEAYESYREKLRRSVQDDDLDTARRIVRRFLNRIDDRTSPFYRAESEYWKGMVLQKTGGDIESVLVAFQNAAFLFERVDDYLGAGLCCDNIATAYREQTSDRTMMYTFYEEAVSWYRKSLDHTHPKRADDGMFSERYIRTRIDEIQTLLRQKKIKN